MAASSSYCGNCGALNSPTAAFCFACGQQLAGAGVPPASSPTEAGSVAPAPVPVGAGSVLPACPPQGVSQPAGVGLLKGRYRLMGQVGKGGFGAVYRAEDTHLGNRLVAVKEMSQHGLDPTELQAATEAFHQEALLLAKLTHPNLPRIYEEFSEGGQWYLVMDFLEGETLEEHLGKLPGGLLAIPETLRLGLQLCEVLEYLHTRQPPIIFRDLKPANVMLTPTGHVYLIDFGIARHFKPGQTRDTVAFGSAGYAAPEQYGKAQTTTQSDIYSLGATLHRLLSGDDPADSPFVFAPLHLSSVPELATVISQMLQPDQAKRPESMAVVRAELQRLADELARQPGQGTQVAAPAPSRVLASAQTPAPDLPLVRPSAVLPISLGKRLCTYNGHSEAVRAVAWSPDGKYLASGGLDGPVQVWDSATALALYTYQEQRQPVSIVAWSRDGRFIASGGMSRSVHVWDATLYDARIGTTLLTYGGPGNLAGKILALAWSPDARLIASGGLDKIVEVWNARTGEILLSYRGHRRWLGEGAILALAWSPDGKWIASGSKDYTVQVWHAATGEALLTYAGHAHLFEGGIGAVAWSPDGNQIASGGSDATVQVWNMLGGTQEMTYRGHTSSIEAVAWSPDGKYVASASEDATVQVVDATTGRLCVRYEGHSGPVYAVAWSPDGKRLASASQDRTVQVWQPK